MKEKNTKIVYLFRDENNFKTENEEIVKGELSKEQMKQITDSLLDGEYFIPERVGLTERRFGRIGCVNELFYELTDILTTDEEPTIDMSADELVHNFVCNRGKWELYSTNHFFERSSCRRLADGKYPLHGSSVSRH